MAAIMAGRIESLRTINGVKFGITKIVKGYNKSNYTSFVAMLAIFVSPCRYNKSKRGRDFWDTLHILLMPLKVYLIGLSYFAMKMCIKSVL